MIETGQTEASRQSSDYNRAYIWTISFVAALGGLLFGYDWVVIGGAKPFYEKFFHLTDPARQGWAKSCALVGCLVGALLSGGLSDKTRPQTACCWLSAFLFAVSSVGTGWRGEFPDFCFLADCRRRGHRPGLEPVADVHRRSRPRPAARQAGGHQPTDHRHRHFAGASRQLADCATKCRRRPRRRRSSAILERPDGLAVDVRRHRRAVAAVLYRHVAGAGKPALAGQKRQAGQSRGKFWRKSAAKNTPRRPWRKSTPALANEIQRVNFRDLLEPEHDAKFCCWASFWPCFSNGAASTSFSTTRRTSFPPPDTTSRTL